MRFVFHYPRFFLGIALLAALLAFAGCGTRQPVTAKTYDAAVAELGEPLRCNDKPDGSRFCSWPETKGKLGVDYKRFLVIQFDRRGRVVKQYYQSTFRP